MCGGSAAAFDAAKPYLDIYCARSVLIGEAGSGQLAKMVNQIAIAGVVEGLAEAVHFTKKAGPRPGQSVRRHFGRRGGELANAQPLADDGRREI